MKKIIKIGFISVGAIIGSFFAKVIVDSCENMIKESEESKVDISKGGIYNNKKLLFEIGKDNESYKVVADNEQEIEKICKELDEYDYRKETMDKDLEYGDECYWKNAKKNEFK